MKSSETIDDRTYSHACYEFNSLVQHVNEEFVPSTASELMPAIVHECDAVHVGNFRYVKVDQYNAVLRKYYDSKASRAAAYLREEVLKNCEQTIKNTATRLVNYSWPVTGEVWQSAYINYVRPDGIHRAWSDDRVAEPKAMKDAEVRALIDELEEAMSQIKYSINQLEDDYSSAKSSLEKLKTALKK
jgi:hypothetical protein